LEALAQISPPIATVDAGNINDPLPMDEEKFKVEFKSSIKKLDKICQRIIDYKSIRTPSLSLLHLIIFIACENSNDAE